MTYSRLAPGDKHRTEILSVVAREYPNKELKQLLTYEDVQGQTKSCSDYELTKARLHCETYGAGA